MRCKNGYRQIPSKSRNCVLKTAKKMSVKKNIPSKSPRKRCKNGTRKNKSGQCVQYNKGKITKSPSTSNNSPSINTYHEVKITLDDVLNVLLDEINENDYKYAKKNFNEFKIKNIKKIYESVMTIQTILDNDPDFDKEDIHDYLEKNGLLDDLYQFDKRFMNK
jgi:hypothetical protein